MKQATNFDSTNMTKKDMASTLAILMGMEGFEGQLEKISIPALRKMFDGLNQNAMAFNLAKQEARFAREHLKVEESRSASLERDLVTLSKETGNTKYMPKKGRK